MEAVVHGRHTFPRPNYHPGILKHMNMKRITSSSSGGKGKNSYLSNTAIACAKSKPGLISESYKAKGTKAQRSFPACQGCVGEHVTLVAVKFPVYLFLSSNLKRTQQPSWVSDEQNRVSRQKLWRNAKNEFSVWIGDAHQCMAEITWPKLRS